MTQTEPQMQLISESPLAAAAFDRDHCYLAASRAWLEQHGLAGKNVVGQSDDDLLGGVPDSWRIDRERALRGEAVGSSQAPWTKPDGKTVWQRRVSQPLRAPDGAIVGVVVFCSDITRQKQIEDAAAANEARVRAILETSPNAIVTFERDGRIDDVNVATENMFGYARNDLVGRPIETLIAPESRASQATYFAHCMRGDDARIVDNSIETQGLRSDGQRFPIELAIGEIDHLGRFTVNMRDQSKRKAAEDALRISHANLERQVRERTRALEAAKVEAERGNAFKTRFLAAASHDLRQPLQSLGLYLGVLARQLEQPEQQEICNKMAQSRDTVAQLLEALLDISRLETGAIAPHKRDFALGPVLERIVDANLPMAKEKGLELHLEPTDCWVHTDAALLERVLDNFVGNAVRYTEQGGVTIVCQRDQGHVRIAVSDSGVGIEAEDLPKVFDEYYQGQHGRRGGRRGFGLGLSIVRHIARLLDHPVDVTSELGRGSTFAISVPIGQGAREAQVADPARYDSRSSSPPVVLVIDDEPAVVDATTMLLRSAGLAVHSAGDGRAAQELLARGVEPDMIICDYRLPGTNGVELIRALRERATRRLPAILLTGDTSGSEIERANLADCVVLHKPVDADRLLSVIGGAIGR